MKLHEIRVYNIYYALIGAIIGFVSAGLSANYKIDNLTAIGMSIVGLFFVLLSSRKPKQSKQEDI